MKKLLAGVAAAAIIAYAGPGSGMSNIDPQNTGKRYGWTENGGWINLRGDDTNGVHAGARHLKGFAWHENFGWINFGSGSPQNGESYSNASATDFGVNVESDGALTGYAWGENIGWIVFNTAGESAEQARIEQESGRFAGYAWGENIGWLSFETVDPAFVATVPGHSAVRDWSLFN